MPRHLGRLAENNAIVAVSYMQIPETQEHALVTLVDDLPDNMNRSLMSLLGSPEAQTTVDLADVLSRRNYADSGKNMLQVLHESGKLKKVHIDDIIMTPESNVRIPLREVLTKIGKLSNVSAGNQTEGFNPHTHNQQVQETATQLSLANNLLIEAQMLSDEANMKRQKAYDMAPSLKPQPAPVQKTMVSESEIKDNVVEGINNYISNSEKPSAESVDIEKE